MNYTSYRTDRSDGVLGGIVSEWESRYSTKTADFGSLGTRRAGELEEAMHNLPKAETNTALHELLTLEHAGHELAGRLVLQLMLPKVAHLTRSCTGFQEQRVPIWERSMVALEAMWEAIHTYPLRRTNSVSGNLSLNALAIITKSHGTYRDPRNMEVPFSGEFIEDILNEEAPNAADEPSWGDSAFHDLVKLLTWAVDAEALTRDEVSLLARFDLGEQDERTALAEELELTPATLSKRVWRIRTKLIEAVREHIRTFGRW